MIKYSDIFKLAVPSIIANITTPLLSLVDTAIAGHLGSPVYLAAIAVGGSMFNMIYYLFAFLRMGTSGLTAQSYGAEDKSGINSALSRSLVFALLFATAIILFQYVIGIIGMFILDPDEETQKYALKYFRILIYGAPAVLMNYSICGWLIGMQRARDTMIISIVVNTVNIGASFMFVYLFSMQIEGIATGTLIAQWSGVAAGLLYVRKNGFSFDGFGKTFRTLFKRQGEKENVNVNIFLRTLCLVAVTVWFTRTGASQGAVMLAVNSLLMQFFILFSYFMDGFAYAGEALAGKFYGAKDYRNLKVTVVKLLKIGAVMALAYTLIYFLCGDLFIRLLSDEEEVRKLAVDYKYWVLTIPFAGFAAFIMDGVFVGMTKTRQMLFSLLFSGLVFYIIWLLLTPVMGNHGLWLAFIVYLLCRGLYLLYKIKKEEILINKILLLPLQQTDKKD